MRRLLLFFLLVCSLWQAGYALQTTPDTARFNQYLSAFNQAPSVKAANAFFQYLNSEEFTDSPIQFSSATHLDTLRQQVWYWAAEYYLDQQDYSNAAAYAYRALPYCRATEGLAIEADCLSLLTIAYIRLGDYRHAAPCAHRLYELDKGSGDPERISSSLNTLAALYETAGQPEQAYHYVNEGIKVCKQAGNRSRLSILYGSAAEISYSLGEYQRSVDYANKAMAIDQQMGNKTKVAIRQAQIAPSLTALGRYKDAENALRQAMPVLKEAGNLHSYAIACNQMGKLLLRQNKHKEAIHFYNEALPIFVGQHDIYNESYTQEGLYQALRHLRPQEALQHNDRCNQLRDSLHASSSGMLIAQYSAQFANSELQSQNRLLQKSYRRNLLLIVCAILVLSLLTWYISARRQQRLQKLQAIISEGSQPQSTHASRQATDDTSQVSPAPTLIPTDADFLQLVNRVVEEAMDEGKCDVEVVAAKLHISPSTLRRRILAITESTSKSYILALQMQRAATLLRERASLSIEEIALRCAFTNPSSFARAFKQFYGKTPKAYAKEAQTSI